MPVGKGELVVIESAGSMVRANSLLVDDWSLSVTLSTQWSVPAVDGRPLITPAAEFKESPPGKFPELTCQVYCPVPPLADRVCE